MRNLFVILFLLFIGQNSAYGSQDVVEMSMGYVTPEMFGAEGKGLTDDTQAIIKALKAPADLMLNGIYLVTDVATPAQSVYLFSVPSNKKIYGGGKIVSTSTKALFMLHSVTKVTFEGVTLDFGKVTNRQHAGNSNHGIVIINSKKLTIKNIKVISPAGDGIYIGSYNEEGNHNKNILISSIIISDFGRQGIALIEGEDIEVKKCVFSNRPACVLGGVDIEPNNVYEAVKTEIRGCRFENCGISTYRSADKIKKNHRITIEDNIIEKQMDLVGGPGTHFAGISVQDALDAKVKNNKVHGFVGISVYNCKNVEIKGNEIYSTYRGLRVFAVEKVRIERNTIRMEKGHNIEEAAKINPGLVRRVGSTIELSSTDGRVVDNDIEGRIWIREFSQIIVKNNICRGERGDLLLNKNKKERNKSKAIVKGNIYAADLF